MLASPTTRVPTGDAWVHEVKWDGIRLLADVGRDPQGTPRLRLTTRTERDVTVAFPELAGLAQTFDDMLLDGEVVLLVDGAPSFQALAERIHVTSAGRAAPLAARAPVTLMAFDLLRLYGVDLTHRVWDDRRATLERLELGGAHWQVPPTFSDGEVLLGATLEQGLEGVVSKRRGASYRPGVRSDDWLKLPHRTSVSLVIGGWMPEKGSPRLGSVHVGVPGPDGLVYLGKVGSGIAGRAGEALARDLASLTRATSPFAAALPREDSVGATWVEPVLVCEVQALGLTTQPRLRQPAYRGLRADLGVADLDATEVLQGLRRA
ncbi:MAG: DNA ligase [Actinomycetota bacterium]|nr:DNA ligase [Actinomycetota bacterium]